MKTRLLAIFRITPALVCTIALGMTAAATTIQGNANPPFGRVTPDQLEQAMLGSINRMRQDPSGYRIQVEEAFELMLKDSVALKQEISETVTTRWIMYESGMVVEQDTVRRNRFDQMRNAYLDLLVDLANAPSMLPLIASPDLYRIASDHAQRSAKDGYLEHQGADGTLPSDRISIAMPWTQEGNENIAAGPGSVDDILLQLMVDSGVDGRGHRNNLLNPEWRYVACHKVDAISTAELGWWMQEFAR